MNPQLQSLLDHIQQSENLSDSEKLNISNTIKEVDKVLSITEFKLDRTEQVKRTTAILLEETIQELEQKRKAVEEQNRELEIESSLERVRTQAMSMRKPEDMLSVCRVIFQQLESLGVENIRNVQTVILNDPLASYTNYEYFNLYDKEIIIDVPYNAHPIIIDFIKQIRTSDDYFFFSKIEGETLTDWRQYLKTGQEKVDPRLESASAMYYYIYSIGPGALGVSTYDTPMPDEDVVVLKRFRNVFQLAYRRYLDIEQAEAQARESQIEAALEKVRGRAMAMHKSEDLNPAVATVFEELEKLSPGMSRCGIGIIDKEKRSATAWITSMTNEGITVQISGEEPLDVHPLLQGALNAWLKQEDFTYILRGNDMVHYYKTSGTGNVRLPESQLIFSEDEVEQQYYHFVSFQAGGLFAFRDTVFPEEAKTVMKRFAGVFHLTYQRFLDLQKAEAQAKEATIDAALEKVRGRAMSMHNSSDLSSTASMVFKELRKLGIVPIRSGVGLLTKENRKATIYAATSAEEGDALSLVGWVMLEDQPVLSAQYESWLRQEDYFPSLKGKELIDYYEKLTPNFSLPDIQTDLEQHGYYLPFRDGFLYCWTEKSYTEAEIKILNRFKAIIDLTFRRYVELQKSEANARDAVRQASLDRVRAEIASMRTTGDLEKITPLIWNELTILGVPFIRCGVFIMDETLQLIHTFLSTPEGKAIAAFHLPYSSPGNIAQVLIHWKKNENYIDHWDETAFKEFAGVLVKEGALTSPEKYLSTMPQGGFYLHFLPFMQGMLYVGNTIQLSTDEIKLVQSVADAFSTAYARYEDFNKLETAKQQVENTLSDLKQAQQQLIQSEKMASLGELTAGIAHEIQNPLNFVNNFSEVNTELIEEMNQEIANANLEEVITIAKDIKENQEKITHHGKRADAIVKGMLQHSRTSSGVKEPTDINALADEYLRLAYHGLRAKDKSFNAKMLTDFDESIGLINVIPQEIGRVILNLITNAFYAVCPPPPEGGFKSTKDGYEPTVIVSTKQWKSPSGDLGAQVSVKDNGNGIPKNVIDKIFQPFFTTKPTGQGTGLGLSLSYDIVKAHGGELKVSTKEGEGTTFIIQLPT